MSSNDRARLRVATLILLMVNAVLFGVGRDHRVEHPTLAQHAFFWIPAVVIASCNSTIGLAY